MPLPRDTAGGSPVIPPTPAETVPRRVSDISRRSGLYNGNELIYLDLNTCDIASCVNGISSSLSPLLRYRFIFEDGTAVLGQRPVFNLASAGQNAPFRRIINVTVPEGYIPNSIQSSEDVINSGFRTVATNEVLNNPIITTALEAANTGQIQGSAWSEGNLVPYLELGAVPYSPVQNRLGVGIAFFMRNRDKTDLPSQPAPIFDSVPGELLYSPIRQVFRAVSENQSDTFNNDPSVGINSQESLLQAVNEGLFRLENTGEFFNYPVQNLLSSEPVTPTPSPNIQRFDLSISRFQNLPTLPADARYILWLRDINNESRLLLDFKLTPAGGFQTPEGNPFNPQDSFFGFSNAEIGNFREFLLTVETENVSVPTGAVILSAQYGGRQQIQLDTPFASRYANLQTGSYMLVTPTDRTINQRSGLWFVQRTDSPQGTPDVPLTLNLEPGLILSLPPEGWTYNGWIRDTAGGNFWLGTGRFRAVNQPDSSITYYDAERSAYPFPGEDFLRNAPRGLFFPVNLPSTGEREVVVSLEPENLSLDRPFFSLFRQNIAKGTPPLRNQPLPFTPVRFPALTLQLDANN